jgi:hypothetical protein
MFALTPKINSNEQHKKALNAMVKLVTYSHGNIATSFLLEEGQLRVEKRRGKVKSPTRGRCACK